jgi:AcrR family transcriptional regulator
MSRNAPILQATLEILAEIGYERMTTDMVATRARASKATLYRRWPSKAELVTEAVGLLGYEIDAIPTDTGSLIGDLAEIRRINGGPPPTGDLRIMAGVLSMLPGDSELAAVVRRRVVLPRTENLNIVLRRAQARGEIAADRDVDMLATVVLAMMTYRLVVTGEPIDQTFISSVLNEILLPAILSGGVIDNHPRAGECGLHGGSGE